MDVSFAKVDLITIFFKFFGDIMELGEGLTFVAYKVGN